MSKTIKQPIISDSDDCKMRVAKCKAVFAQKGLKSYLTAFVKMYPEYDSIEYLNKLTAVFQLRSFDVEMTEKIEVFTKSL